MTGKRCNRTKKETERQGRRKDAAEQEGKYAVEEGDNDSKVQVNIDTFG